MAKVELQNALGERSRLPVTTQNIENSMTRGEAYRVISNPNSKEQELIKALNYLIGKGAVIGTEWRERFGEKLIF